MANVLRMRTWAAMDAPERAALMDRGLADIFDPGLRRSIERIVEDVRTGGDEAVCRALHDFDHVDVEPDELRVGDDEWDAAAAGVAPEVHAAIDDAIDHLRRFNEQLLARAADWSFESEPGLVVGEKVGPISSAGLFCPSGKASYPSVAYQLGVPAVVAGVPTVAMVVPPVPGTGGAVDPAVLVVCQRLGLREVFRVNGPAGVAALGFGTERIPRVRKVVGPGSPAVTCAQVEMQRHGVATMMVLGPTEAMVVADGTADPERLAADLLNEAEHGTDSSVVLVTPDRELAARTDAALARQVAELPAARAEAARAALGTNGGCVLVDDLDAALEVANGYAAEHLMLVVDPAVEDDVLDGLHNAGEILVGHHTPFSAGNFLIGCPASLPTSGFAHVSSGITAEAFLKRTAVAKADDRALRRMAPSILALCAHEGFPAHANAVRRRLGG